MQSAAFDRTVMTTPEELASMEDTLDLLSDPTAMAKVAAARAAYADGDYASAEELRARYLRPNRCRSRKDTSRSAWPARPSAS